MESSIGEKQGGQTLKKLVQVLGRGGGTFAQRGRQPAQPTYKRIGWLVGGPAGAAKLVAIGLLAWRHHTGPASS